MEIKIRIAITVAEDAVVEAVAAEVDVVEEVVAVAAVVVVVVDGIYKNDMMKNKKHIGLILIAGLTLLLPFIYIHTWNPFSIKGPLFLKFYMLLMLIVYVDIALLKGRNAALIIGITTILGVARIIQGLYNEKPVGYLVLLLILHLAISGLMSRGRIGTTS